MQKLLDNSRAFSTRVKPGPEKFKRAVRRRIDERTFRRWWETGVRYGRLIYRDHLRQLRRELWHGFNDDDFDFGAALREHPALYLYFRVVLTCVLIHRTTPQRLMQQLRSARSETKRAEAAERLVRVDPWGHTLPDLIRWQNADDGVVRREREALVLRWRGKGLRHGRFDRAGFKAALGALIQSIACRQGSHLDHRGQWQPGSMTAPDVRRLLDAVARDRAGSSRVLIDPDLADTEPDSWRKQVSRYRPVWDKLLIEIPGPTPAPGSANPRKCEPPETRTQVARSCVRGGRV